MFWKNFNKDKLEKNLYKVDFIWVNRDYQSFEWFIELLGQIELQQLNMISSSSENTVDRFIQIHLYMTSAKCEQDIKLIENFLNTKNGKTKDFSLKLIPGRPDFDSVFYSISF